MKPRPIVRILSMVLILSVLVSLVSWGDFPTTPKAHASNLQSPHTLDVDSYRNLQTAGVHALPQQYVAHDPIVIEGNADFAALGFPGEGSPSNPYVIEGLHITAFKTVSYKHPTVHISAKTFIYIQNTTVHFSIRNNLLNSLTGEPYGIFLYNVTHGTIDSNIISNCLYGISIYYSRQTTVSYNTVSNINHYGISLIFSGQTTVAYNTVSQNHIIGIFLHHAEQITVTYNTVSQNRFGIWLEDYGQNIVAHNTVSQNNHTGIILTDCARQNTISSNILSYNRRYGLWLQGGDYTSRNNTVKENDFLGNNPGGSSQARDDCVQGYRENVFTRNYWVDHENTDRNGDGIADTPYPIMGDASTQDLTPLAFPANLNRHLLLIPIIQYPNGGETLQGMEMIEWTGARDSLGHPVIYAITYSPDNGNTWIPLASGLSTTSYEWNTTTMVNGAAYRVQVVATCSNGLSTEDRSDATFSIRNIAHNLSVPTILYPNGGETLQGTVILHWTPANDTWEHSVTYTISYSANDGQTWIPLASGLSTSEYEWDTTTVEDGSAYRIQVVATCSEGLTVDDISDAPFTIQNPVVTTTVGAFPLPGMPVTMLFVTLLLFLAMHSGRRGKRQVR